MSILPLATLEAVSRDEGNALLERWQHKMGPNIRPYRPARCHVLLDAMRNPLAVSMTDDLVREAVGGVPFVNRENGVELSRLCAVRSGLCRVMLRLWRELIFPMEGKRWAISYQDAVLHKGSIYRHDGWTRVGYTRSGTDSRSGRKGRNKYVWVWPPPPTELLEGRKGHE